MSLYTLKQLHHAEFRVTKLSYDLEVVATYIITNRMCQCPARSFHCKHRKMFGRLLRRVDTAWAIDDETNRWVDTGGYDVC